MRLVKSEVMLKKIKHIKTSFSRALVAPLLAGLLVSAGSISAQMQSPQQGQPQGNEGQAPNQQQIQERLQQLQAELQVLNAEIQTVQSEANQAPAVRQALKNYSETLTEQMKVIAPEQVELIDRRQEIYDQLLAINDGSGMSQAEQTQLQELGQEFNTVRQELQMVEAQANQSEEVQEAMSGYNDNLLETMSESDPEIMDKIQRHQVVSQEFTQLRNAIMQQQ